MSLTALPKKISLGEISKYVSVIATTAMAVFWVMNYVNSPINKIQTDVAVIRENVQQLTDAKIVYDKTNEAQTAKLQKIDQELAIMSQQLVDRGIIVRIAP